MYIKIDHLTLPALATLAFTNNKRKRKEEKRREKKRGVALPIHAQQLKILTEAARHQGIPAAAFARRAAFGAQGPRIGPSKISHRHPGHGEVVPAAPAPGRSRGHGL